MNEVEKIILEKIERIEKCMTVARQLVEIGISGNVDKFEEAFEEIFMESSADAAKKVTSYAKQIIIHLFKLEYGRYAGSQQHLLKEIKNFREEIATITRWDGNKPDKNIIKLVKEDMYLAYRRAKNAFQDILEETPEDYVIDVKHLRNFPDECPWTLGELMEYNPLDIIEVLPRPH